MGPWHLREAAHHVRRVSQPSIPAGDRRCRGYEAVGYTILLPASAIPGWPADVVLPSDPVAYRRDRRKDQLLQENGYLVLRFLAEDVGKELNLVLDAILRALSHRLASAPNVDPLTFARRDHQLLR
jgi:hypothetical protein